MYLLVTVPGLEEAVIEECRRAGCRGLRRAPGLRGRVVCEVCDAAVLRRLRTVERVIKLLRIGRSSEVYSDYKRFFKSLVDCSEIREFLKPSMTFAVRVTREGDHSFTSMDVARVVGEAIKECVDAVVDLNGPDVVFHVDVCNDAFAIGIDVTGFRTMHYRPYRRYIHPASINPIIAAGMAVLSGASKEDSILDPFCGSGTILIETHLVTGSTRLLGIEIEEHHAIGALRNIEAAGLRGVVDIVVGDAREPPIAGRRFDYLITNPPYGIREPAHVKELYHHLMELVRNHVDKKAVIVSPRRKTVFIAAEDKGLKIEKVIEIFQGGMYSWIYVITSP